MYVVSVDTILNWTEWPVHQVALKKDVLQSYSNSHQGHIVFVSHEWLDFAQPDPEARHLRCLQRHLRGFMERRWTAVETNSVDAMNGYDKLVVSADQWAEATPQLLLWIDYPCFPQAGADLDVDVDLIGVEDRTRALHRMAAASIPAYVERSDIMLILTPLSTHYGRLRSCHFGSWQNRGWCRWEVWCHALCKERSVVLKCGDGAPSFMPVERLLLVRCLQGDFTCCQREHLIDGQRIPCDRLAVASVLEHTFASKLRSLLQRQKFPEFRALSSLRWWILCGEGGVQPIESSTATPSASLARSLRWAAGDADHGSGESLLVHAALQDLSDVIHELAAREPAAMSLVWQPATPALRSIALTPLVASAAFASFDTVEALLEAKADPLQRVSFRGVNGAIAFLVGAAMGRPETIAAWVKRYPSSAVHHAVDWTHGFSALHTALCFHPSPATMARELLLGRADVLQKTTFGISPLHAAAIGQFSDVAALRLLLEHEANPNVQVKGSRLRIIRTARVSTSVDHESLLRVDAARISEWTPLQLACSNFRLEEAKLLLAHGAHFAVSGPRGEAMPELVQRQLGDEQLPAEFLSFLSLAETGAFNAAIIPALLRSHTASSSAAESKAVQEQGATREAQPEFELELESI